MNCPNCGTVNNNEFKFCIKCGGSLPTNTSATQTQIQQPNMMQSQDPIPSTTPVAQPAMNQNFAQNSSAGVGGVTLNYLMYIILVLIKPFQCFKEEEQKLSNTKTSLILGLIVAGGMMLINLIRSMISVTFVKTLDYSTFQTKTVFQFDNLKNLDYVSLIGKQLLIYIGILGAIALVYYLASLIVKKSASFPKILSITATSIIPFAIIAMIVSPILGKIWSPLSIVTMLMGVIYFIAIFICLIQEDISFEKKDFAIYFHVACLTILTTVGYYAFVFILTNAITSKASSYLNLMS